jgi:hypothetical protein
MALPTATAVSAARRSILNVTGVTRVTNYLASTRKWPRRFAILGIASVTGLATIMWYDHPQLRPYRHQVVAAARVPTEILHHTRHNPRKKLLLQTVHGRILEIGPAHGYNLQYYNWYPDKRYFTSNVYFPPGRTDDDRQRVQLMEAKNENQRDVLTVWHGIEPNTAMKPYITSTLAKIGVPAPILHLVCYIELLFMIIHRIYMLSVVVWLNNRMKQILRKHWQRHHH